MPKYSCIISSSFPFAVTVITNHDDHIVIFITNTIKSDHQSFICLSFLFCVTVPSASFLLKFVYIHLRKRSRRGSGSLPAPVPPFFFVFTIWNFSPQTIKLSKLNNPANIVNVGQQFFEIFSNRNYFWNFLMNVPRFWFNLLTESVSLGGQDWPAS